MRFEDTFFSREDRYSLGTVATIDRKYASIPVSNGFVDYEALYEITDAQYERFLADHDSALEFVNACRRREKDDLLLEPPGPNRGVAS